VALLCNRGVSSGTCYRQVEVYVYVAQSDGRVLRRGLDHRLHPLHDGRGGREHRRHQLRREQYTLEGPGETL
jgi:hypothetical protein